MRPGERRLNFRESYHYRPSRARRLLHVVLLLAAAWFFGFLLFIAAIPTEVADRQSRTDVVVVLTGGGERVGEGFELLSRGLAPQLYISGVAEGVTLDDLTRKVAEAGGNLPSEAMLKCCVSIDRAQNTTGNAVASTQWFAEQHIQSIRLVTANYHMNRSLLEFRRAKSGLTVVPNPVFPPEMRDPLWFLKPRILIVLGNEYHKYLAASLRADIWSVGAMLRDATADFRQGVASSLEPVQSWLSHLLHRA
ncbi:MAG TPA: YdcF family protein [Terriglobia bacterium]|nr:YdcF family protein [Terriglobia bacterium]